jgi:uncharacterized membrane protein
MWQKIIISAITMIILDSAFLVANRVVLEKQILDVQQSSLKINPVGLLVCYVILVTGLYYFIIREKRSVLDAFLLGVLVYGVYETTNLATLAKWKPTTVMLDTIWGGVLFASTTYITNRAAKYLRA